MMRNILLSFSVSLRMLRMVLWAFFLLCIVAWTEVRAQQPSSRVTPDFYAEITSNRDSLIVGDSCVVSIVLYANLPFESVEQNPRTVRFSKEIRARELPTERSQQQVRTPRGVYYALVWQHYRVSRKEVGRIVWPELQFSAELGVYQVEDDGWGGFFSFEPSMRLVEKRKAKCKAPRFVLPVVERPKRSTQDLMRSGRQVM